MEHTRMRVGLCVRARAGAMEATDANEGKLAMEGAPILLCDESCACMPMFKASAC